MLQIAIDKIPVKKVGIKGLKGRKGRKGKAGSSMLSLLFGGIGRQEMEAGGEMDDLAVEAGGGEDVVDGAGDVERRRADFGGGGLDEAVHPFEGEGDLWRTDHDLPLGRADAAAEAVRIIEALRRDD